MVGVIRGVAVCAQRIGVEEAGGFDGFNLCVDFLNGEFDLILAMDFENLNNIQALMRSAEAEFGSLRAKIALMSEHDPHYTQQELPDPYYGEADGFERVLDQCESSSRAWVKVLQQQFELKV